MELKTGFNVVKGEMFFITHGAYSDTQYYVFKALKDINDSVLQPIFDHCLTHEFDREWCEDIEPIHFMVMLERAGIVKRIPMGKTLSFNYSLSDVDFYERDYAGEEYRDALKMIDELKQIKKEC